MHKSSGKFQVSYACFQFSFEKGKERKGKLNQLIILFYIIYALYVPLLLTELIYKMGHIIFDLLLTTP